MAYDPWSRTDLRERVAREYLPGPGPRTGVGAERDGLVDEREARQAWRGQAPATGGRKPKLVVVCCSGGGARSLVWTATVLDRLGQAVPGFDDSVRVIAAGSAGGPGPGTTSRRGTTGCRSRGPPACRPASGSSRPDGRRQSPATASRQSYGRSRWPRSGGCSTRGRCAGPPQRPGPGAEAPVGAAQPAPAGGAPRGRTGGAGPVADPRADHPGGRPPAVHQQPRPPQPRPEPRRPASATARATASEPRARPVRRLGAAVQPGGLVGGPGHAGAGRLRRRSGEWARPVQPGGRRVGAGGRPAAAGGPEEPAPALGRGPDELLAHGRRVRPRVRPGERVPAGDGRADVGQLPDGLTGGQPADEAAGSGWSTPATTTTTG